MVDRLANRRVEESNETLDNRWDILQMQPLRYQLIGIQEQDFNSPRRVIIRESGEGHGRHVVEPHATTSQPPTSHLSRTTSNIGNEAITEENHYFAGTMAKYGSQGNDASVNADFPTSENDIGYPEGHHPEL